MMSLISSSAGVFFIYPTRRFPNQTHFKGVDRKICFSAQQKFRNILIIYFFGSLLASISFDGKAKTKSSPANINPSRPQKAIS